METEYRNEVTNQVAKHWLSILIYGLAFTAIGIVAIVVPAVATLATEILVAWLLIFAGIAGLIFTWKMRDTFDWWYNGLIFLLTLALGLVFLVYPKAGIATLTMLMVALFLFEGVLSVVFGVRLRETLASWGWIVFSGATSIIVAILILAGWPATAAWAIGLLVGINLLSTGLSLIMLSLAGRILPQPDSARK